MWVLHIGGTADGAGSVALSVGLFLLLLLHSLAYVLLFQRPLRARSRDRLRWGLVLLIPLIGPLGYLVRPRSVGARDA